ncbi:hypothetical protein FA13DRAFT_1741198 [Coprinellus micaceus]|uniref:Uncharacterized protein n=1 Tax=Coprinellus micaceus TaxID=71717 RepID=A0A4Y7SK46_COPMI|nr:hypothetical protein FA13DRAFT_1741198 [Coprinellus micaceus]
MTQRHSLNQRDFGKKIEGLFKHTFEPDIPKDAKLKFFTMNLDACPGVRVDIPAEALEGAIHRLKVRVLGAEIDPTGSSFAGADEAGAGEWD